MSHFTIVKTQVKCLATLKKALDDLGLVYTDQDTEVKDYYGARQTGDLKITSGHYAYDIGVVRQEDGTYAFPADWDMLQHVTHAGFGGKLKEQDVINRISQRYSYHRAVEEAEAMGYTVLDESYCEDNGQIHLKLRRWT